MARAPSMLSVRFSNFRAFGSTGIVDIRPITFLIGENSTGKTSFLAGLRQIFESFAPIQQNPFNRDPYFLGSFEQIAHYKGGRNGRAKSFSLTAILPDARPSQASLPGLGKTQHGGATHTFVFAKGTPQPELQSYTFSDPEIRASVTLDGEKPKITVNPKSGAALQLQPKRLPPSNLVRRNSSYISYLFDEFILDDRVQARALTDKAPTLDKNNFLPERAFRVFEQSSRFLSLRTYASAPVRTEPRRTYTPSEITPSSLGAHVPLELARMKANAPDRWKETREALVSFGKSSGLFEDIEIRQLGKRDGDPFQVLVKIKGPPVNLADVGYGVSQALPIIYMLQNSANYDAFFLQQPEVHLHPRAQAEIGSLLSNISQQQRSPIFVVETHSDYIIDRVRIEISEGRLDSSKVSIVFFDRTEKGIKLHNLTINKEGEIIGAPATFRNFFLSEHARLLGL